MTGGDSKPRANFLTKEENRIKKILFICHGNICRSPMAEFIMKDLVEKSGLGGEFYIESAATSTEELGNDIYPPAKAKLREKGIPFSRRGARQMSKRDYSAFDLIVAMDSYNLRNIMRIIGSDPEKKVCRLLDFTAKKGSDIDDPWYSGDFERAYNDIAEGCRGLLDSLR